jgi:SOS-response transcriptional repressor LexA
MGRHLSLKGDEARDKILDYIELYTRSFGIPPTMREIYRKLKFSSTSVVYYHIQKLLDQHKIYMVGTDQTIRYMPINARICWSDEGANSNVSQTSR